MTETDGVRAAFGAGGSAERRCRCGPGELVGAAWQGAVEERNGGARLAATAAYRRAIDAYRKDARQARWAPAGTRQPALSGLRQATGDYRNPGEVAPTARPEDWHARLLGLWSETRPLRSAWHPRLRIMLYLYAVEGWTVREVADAWGVSRSAACKWFSRLGCPREFDAVGHARLAASGAEPTMVC